MWEHFNLISSLKVQCLVCHQQLAYNNHTLSMLRHFRAKHEAGQAAASIHGDRMAKIDEDVRPEAGRKDKDAETLTPKYLLLPYPSTRNLSTGSVTSWIHGDGVGSYLVYWEDYGPEEHLWLPRDDILDPALLDQFLEDRPDRPAPRGQGRPRRRVRPSSQPSGAAFGGGGTVRVPPSPARTPPPLSPTHTPPTDPYSSSPTPIRHSRSPQY